MNSHIRKEPIMYTFLQLFKRFVWKLELYEIIGISVTIIAVVTFFASGHQLDLLKGQQGYHWQPVIWVFHYYSTFIPESIFIGIVCLAGYFLLTKRPMQQLPKVALGIIRVFLPFCILLAVYRTLNFFIPLFDSHDKDQALLHIDQWIFGVQPSIWLQHWTRPWLTDYMSFVYAGWFPLIFITIVILLIKNQKGVSEFLTISLVTFYIGYTTFI